jgi:hypothetical protein
MYFLAASVVSWGLPEILCLVMSRQGSGYVCSDLMDVTEAVGIKFSSLDFRVWHINLKMA